ncbi:hypothetical protein GC207_14115 [bacterium]|nr:hypothetical protein [bacterium]
MPTPTSSISKVTEKHSAWVRFTHWLTSVCFLLLAVSGFVILMCHPRLYWGEAGNDLTPALLELPISRNYQHGGWSESVAFFDGADSPVSSSRTYEIFNQNGWARSLHFLAAWLLVGAGSVYLLFGATTRHFRAHLLPKSDEVTIDRFREEFKKHLCLNIRPATGGPQYGLLQKIVYMGVVFVSLPLMVVTGFAMSPAITATFPFLLDVFGGFQSARTVHFFAFAALLIFVMVHVLMIVRSGFKRQMRAMTIGETRRD